MTPRLAVTAAGVGIVALSAAGSARQSVGPMRRPAPVFAPADHFDVSPPLRSLPPLPPRQGAMREMPRYRKSIGPRSADPVVQSTPTTPLVPAPSLTFEGVNNINGVLPPDTNGDVGPNHFVQWVNLSFAIYTKGSGTTAPALIYGPAAGNTLWKGFGGPCEATNNGDPVVRYDHLADRWVMSQLAIPNAFLGIIVGPFYQCIAVSATPDPTGSYYRYQYSFSHLNDYPKLGVWPDAYYMTMNQFTAPSLQWAGQGVVAFDRAAMLIGQPAAMVYFDLSSVDMNLGGMLPSDLDGPAPPPGSPNYFVQVDDDAWGYSPDQLQLWRFHVDWANPSASSFTLGALLATAPFDSNMCGYAENCVPQAGTTVKVDALADRLMYRLQYRNFGTHESLVANHTVDADGTDHAGIRWYEIRDPGGTPAIYQQGTYAPDRDHRWMASAAMDGAGDLAIGFSVSSVATSPSIRYAGRLAGDPPGVLAQGETELMTGSGAQTNSSGRWGDYSMLTVDPVDDCTFWYTQQYYATTSDSLWRTRIGSFQFPTCTAASLPLPSVTAAATVAVATEAGPVAGEFTLSRTGDTSAPLAINYTTSGTATSGSDYVPLSGTVTIPAGSATAAIALMPIDDTLVEPNESVILTIGPDPAYAVGVPASAVVSIVSDDVPPDLVVTALAAPAVGGANAALTLTDTTKNQGSGPSDPSTTGFYLSKDFTLGSDDALFGTRAVPTLGIGSSSSGSTTATIPAGTATGIYYVIAKADVANVIPETVETNNTRWTTIAIGPDLVVSALSAPVTAAAGGAITVSDTTLNRGGDTAGASTTSFYLSTNVSLDSSDVRLGSRDVPALAAGTSSVASTSLTIPAGTAAGTYYVLAASDSGGAVVESSEANNVKFASATRVGADLVVSSVTAPQIAGAGGPILIGDTTTNQGAGDAPASTTAFYLSANLSLDSSDVLLGSRSIPALAGGAASTGSTTVTVPSNTPTGGYYILARADNGNDVAESLETNNTRNSLLLRIGPDLTQVGTTAPLIGGAGGTITVGDTTKNQGGGAAAASTTALYISTSAYFTSSAIQLTTHAVPPLDPSATSTASTPVTLPANLATGSYYVLAYADVNNQVVETVEANNAGIGALIRVGPDLTVRALSSPSSAVAGTTITVATTVLNQGGGAAPASTTRFYLSINSTLDASDVPLGGAAVDSLAAGQSAAGAATITIPAGTLAGGYWLLAVADGDGVVPETVETNNARAAYIKVSSGS